MRRRGMKSTFRATGQTGILITGDGVPLDAVIADFMAGSIEWLTPDNDPDHWDHDRGAGQPVHVSYSGVTLALIHGGQPDALILCHEPTRTHMRGLPDYATQPRGPARYRPAAGARRQPGLRCGGISVNTQHMAEAEARAISPRSRPDGPAGDRSLPLRLQTPGGCAGRDLDRIALGSGAGPPAGIFSARRKGRTLRIEVTRDVFRLAQVSPSAVVHGPRRRC
jgi:hypothetical protein